MVILAIDPGNEKCGIAVVAKGSVVVKQVAGRDEYLEIVKRLAEDYQVNFIVLGDGTGSKEFLVEIKGALATFSVRTIDERLSTEEARRRYWIDHKPKGLRRLLPTSMQLPPEPYDDYVAVILAERFVAQKR